VPDERLAAAVGGAGVDDRARELGGRRDVQGDVEEAGARDVHALDARDAGETAGDDGGHLTGRPAGLFGELQGDVRGPVAMLALLGSLHPHLGRDGDLEVARIHGRDQAVTESGRELGRRHPSRVSAGATRTAQGFLAAMRSEPATGTAVGGMMAVEIRSTGV